MMRGTKQSIDHFEKARQLFHDKNKTIVEDLYFNQSFHLKKYK